MNSLLLLLASAALAFFVRILFLIQSTGFASVLQTPETPNDLQEVTDGQFPVNLDLGEPGRDQPLQLKVNADMETWLYKALYFKIQNLEYHQDVLPEARQTLFGLLYEGLSIERGRLRGESILNIQMYSAETLQDFLIAEHDSVMAEWEKYVDRRERGGAPELFSSRQSAIEWIKKQTPVKYVDGAWLGHIHKITTPFALRGVTKSAWQVLSEELGDGDLEKNHVFLYASLLEDLGVTLPSSYDADFIHPRHQIGDVFIWKAGTTQLLISLFPHEFLPEILGFNLHYELLTIETLKATRELPEFRISGYYFALHVSIDNAHSGHTAMALETVIRYLNIVREQNPAMIPEIWRRIQVGYILSKTSNERRLLSDKERRVVDMLRLKANSSHKIHCSSRVNVGGQNLAQWLSPDTWTDSEVCRRDFLRALSNARPWVIRGNSSKSLLTRELAWNGRMFGAFTNKEVEDLKLWIDDLKCILTDCEKQYWAEVQSQGLSKKADTFHPTVQDVTVHHPVFLPQPKLHCSMSTSDAAYYDWTGPQSGSLDIVGASPNAILPLWFVHPCLLENMVSIPYRTATPLASHIIRVLRAELGYLEEGLGVAGIDEQLRSPDGQNLLSLGLEMNDRLDRPRPANIKDVLEASSQESTITFSKAMLSLSLRPIQHETRLFGLALAFLDFEVAVAENSGLLSSGSQQALRNIVVRKGIALKHCFQALKESTSKRIEVVEHYFAGRAQIADVLQLRDA